VTIDPKTGSDLWTVSASGPADPVPLLQTPFNESHARVSPDGRWLAYMSNDSGRQNVFVTTFPTPGAIVPVSTEGGSMPVWSRDSRELYYRDFKGQLMSVAIDATTPLSARRPQPLFTLNAVSAAMGIGTVYDVAADGRFLVNVLVERSTPPATIITNWTPSGR